MPASIVDLEDMNRPAPSGGITLLLVEDEVIVAEDVKKRLENLGYTVLGVATRGKEAIEMAETLRPCLILMDIGLRGGMDGIETVHRIREKIDVPVIFASAYSDDVTLERAKKAGPQGFVLKPFEERELRTTIEMAIQKHSAEKLLRDNESLFRKVFERVPDGLIVENSDRKIRLVNSSFYRIFKIPPTAVLVGEDTRAVSTRNPPPFADCGEFLRRVEAAIKAGVPLIDEPLVATDGRNILMTYTPVQEIRGGTIHIWQFHESGPGRT